MSDTELNQEIEIGGPKAPKARKNGNQQNLMKIISIAVTAAILAAAAVGVPLYLQWDSTKLLLAETEAELEGTVAERDSLQLNVEQLNLDLSEALDNISTLSSDLNAMEGQYQTTLTQLNSTKTLLDTTEGQLASTKTLLDTTSTELTNTKSELDNKQLELETALAEIVTLGDALDDAEAQLVIEKARNEGIAALEAQVAGLQVTMNGLENQITELQSQVEIADSHLYAIWSILDSAPLFLTLSEAIVVLNQIVDVINSYY
jgi:chromosome segregation ATPase